MKRYMLLGIVLVLAINMAGLVHAQDPTPDPGKEGLDTTTLTAYDQPIEEAVVELEELGIIPSGGSEIFREPYAYFEGTGSWFTSLARYRPYTHVIMAGELTFNIGTVDSFESCSFMVRIISEGGSASTYLSVGLSNTGHLFLIDMVGGELNNFDETGILGDPGDPHHLMLLVFRDELDIYLDGELVLEDVAVDERAGTYGVSLIALGAGARCEGRDIWGWEVDEVVEFGDDCGVVAANTVNLRTGPGTTFDRAGTLESGQTALIVGQAEGDDGFVWWKLETDAWVRSDIVMAGGQCEAVPEVES